MVAEVNEIEAQKQSKIPMVLDMELEEVNANKIHTATQWRRQWEIRR